MSWSLDAPLLQATLHGAQRSTASRYGFAALTVGCVSAIAILIRIVLDEHGHPETLLVLGVVLATWFGGLGPGIFATALSAAVANFFLMGPSLIEEGVLLNLGVLVVVSLITASLYDALRGAQKEEQHLREEVSAAEELVGFVSHELRNPATVIGGNLRLLSRQPEVRANQALLSTVTMVEEEVSELASIIDHLLVLSAAGDHAVVCREPVLLPRLLAAEIRNHQARFPRRPMTLNYCDRCELVEANQEHIRIILRNFFENAEKYSPDAGAPLEVVVSPRAANKVGVAVRDRGIGINEAEANSVFESFYRSDAVKGARAGFGLGLAVCKRLAVAGGGEIWAKPRPGGGSEFGFSLDALLLHGDEEL